MSDLYPVIEDIISLLNNKFGTDISAEKILNAYTPKMDENKKEFTEDDIKWILQQLKSHTFSGGVKGLVKRMGDKFNNDLKQTIYDASRVHGDLEGVVKFLLNYDKLKDKLPKGRSPENKSPAKNVGPGEMDVEHTKLVKLKGESLKGNIARVKKYISDIKEKFPEKYAGSFFEYTEKFLTAFQKYLQSSDQSLSAERDILEIFTTDKKADMLGLMKGWQKLKAKDATDAMSDIHKKVTNYFSQIENEVYLSDDEIPKEKLDKMSPMRRRFREVFKKNTPPEPKNDIEKTLRNLNKVRPEFRDEDREIVKEMSGEKRKELREDIKDVPKSDAYKYALSGIKEYFKKAKSSYPDDFDQYGLHQYTANLVNAMEDYIAGEGRDEGTNKKITAIFNDEPGILKKWDEINKPLAKKLREYKSSFSSLVKTKKNNPSSIDKGVLGKIEKLADRLNLNISDKDRAIAKGLLGKKERQYPDSGIEIYNTDLFNKLVKEVVKHRKDLPKNPEKGDLDKLNLSEEELKKIETKEYLSIVNKVITEVFNLLKKDEDITDQDLSSKIINKFKKEDSDKKEKQEQDKKVVMDRDLKKEQEEAKNKSEAPQKKKESSINIVSNYKETLFYRLERLASMAEDKLVKAEIESISQDIKQLL